jgi:hypothetical protein
VFFDLACTNEQQREWASSKQQQGINGQQARIYLLLLLIDDIIRLSLLAYYSTILPNLHQ